MIRSAQQAWPSFNVGLGIKVITRKYCLIHAPLTFETGVSSVDWFHTTCIERVVVSELNLLILNIRKNCNFFIRASKSGA